MLPSTPSHLRVLSYNVHHCSPAGLRRAIDVEAVSAVINRHTPDVVALQEVDVNTARCGHVDQAQLLARLTGMHGFFAKALDFSGGEFGNVILSKFPLRDCQAQMLPSLPELDGEPRGLATARIQMPDGFEFVFANTHLDSLETEDNRLLQVEAVCQTLASMLGPVVLAGDFNATPTSATIRILEQTFERTQRDGAFTFPAIEPVETIDYIVYNAKSHLRVESYQIIDERQASDHRPVVCTFQITKK